MAKSTAKCPPLCLVALAWNTHPRWRLVLLGNRDEQFARPSTPLAQWPDAPIAAGRDALSGGTWMGLGPDGRAAVVTNVRDGLPQPFDGPSRGELPVAFLRGHANALEHAHALAAHANRYAPFNLIVADRNSCAYVGNHPASGAHAISAGVHGLSNGDFDEDWPKTRHLKAALTQWLHAQAESLEPLWEALADRTVASDDRLPSTGIPLALERRLSPAFVQEQDYGTRASTLILVGYDGSAQILERRFGPGGAPLGETAFRQP